MKLTKYWTEEKINELKFSYENLSKEEIIKKFPEYKWRSIQNVAYFMGFKKGFCETRNGNVENLFNKSNESYYWLGLIVTDGYVSKEGELKIELAVKDYLYLKKLSDFLNTNINIYPPYKSSKPNSNGTCRIKIKDIKNGVKLRNLLGIEKQKSYNPINLNFINERKELLSFLGGYIDGDGTINKEGDIKIDAHINYKDFMFLFGDKLVTEKIITKFTIITYADMVRISFPRKDGIKLKKMLLELNLPIMVRKWDRVPENEKNKTNYLKENKDKIISLRKEGKTYKEICEIISYKSHGTLCSFINKNI